MTKPDDFDFALFPNRYSDVCMSVCPAWLTCRDGEGMPHYCPDCNKKFFIYTKGIAKTTYSLIEERKRT